MRIKAFSQVYFLEYEFPGNVIFFLLNASFVYLWLYDYVEQAC